ncbi:MAG: hypothetical protein HW389_280 [Bacteroidetes bacterium]|nr:hypothetical protein [Bacteroidota bacterium]
MRLGFQSLLDCGVSGLVTTVSLEKYLNDANAWEILRCGVQLAHKMGLRVWIYDEKGYPSGAAGGLVLEKYPKGEAEGLIQAFNNDGRPRYEVSKLFENTHATANFFERRHYINILDREAVATFINVTHDSYERALHPIGDYVEAFFTDEPSLISTYVPAGLDYPKTLPWHESLPRVFQSRKGYDITAHWESLFVDTGEIDRKMRCDFYEVISDLCAETYFAQLQDWCQAHKVMSSGHLLGEETLVWQTLFDGDPFTCYRKFDIPGIDMILSSPERIMQDREPFFLVPKVASSAARLQGKRRVMCEISDFFGSMGGRHASLAQMKCTAGVLMSLGITDFTSFYSVSLNPNQPPDPALKSRRFSVQEYRQYTDYVSRVNTALGEGTYHRRTAVLHPIVSVWANFTPPTRSMYEPHPSDRVRFIDESFANLCRELIQHQVEYDIMDEKNMAAGRVEGKTLVVGEHAYDVVVLPPMDTIRVQTLETIHRFAQQGGSVFAYPLHPQFAAEGVEKDGDIKKMMAAIIAKGSASIIAQITTPIHYLIRSRVPPVCHLTPASSSILCTTLSRDNGRTYFLVNASSAEYSGAGVFRSAGNATIIDPATGEEQRVELKKMGDGGSQVALTLPPFASLFVEFR